MPSCAVKLIALARQKPRYGYRRLGALLERSGWPASRNGYIAYTAKNTWRYEAETERL